MEVAAMEAAAMEAAMEVAAVEAAMEVAAVAMVVAVAAGPAARERGTHSTRTARSTP